jgi:osmotically-inducible protein OsmY
MPESKAFAEAQLPAAASSAEPAPNARARALDPVSHDVVLQIRILDQLNASPELAAAEIRVVVRNRSATLFGAVSSEPQRNLCQRLATEVSGIIEVTNRLKIVAPM